MKDEKLLRAFGGATGLPLSELTPFNTWTVLTPRLCENHSAKETSRWKDDTYSQPCARAASSSVNGLCSASDAASNAAPWSALEETVVPTNVRMNNRQESRLRF